MAFILQKSFSVHTIPICINFVIIFKSSQNKSPDAIMSLTILKEKLTPLIWPWNLCKHYISLYLTLKSFINFSFDFAYAYLIIYLAEWTNILQRHKFLKQTLREKKWIEHSDYNMPEKGFSECIPVSSYGLKLIYIHYSPLVIRMYAKFPHTVP